MINRTNQIVTLEDGREYGIIKHIVYQGRTFYIASEHIKGTENFVEDILILEQLIHNDKECIQIVDDPQIISVIVDNVKNPE